MYLSYVLIIYYPVRAGACQSAIFSGDVKPTRDEADSVALLNQVQEVRKQEVQVID